VTHAQAQGGERKGRILQVKEDPSIRRHQIANRLTDVERRLLTYLSKNQNLITCVGNIGAGKSSLVKLLAYSTGMNALFELPDEGFEDHIAQNPSLFPLLATAKDSAKRTLGRYYGAINEFIEVQAREAAESPGWSAAKRNLEHAALDIQHAYLDLRKMLRFRLSPTSSPPRASTVHLWQTATPSARSCTGTWMCLISPPSLSTSSMPDWIASSGLW
jgi:hypothetical protein